MLELEFHQLELRYANLRIISKEITARLLSSLATHGQRDPVLVVESENNHWILIDGYHRVSCLRTLKKDTVLALRLDLPERDALIYHHRQSQSRVRSVLEEGWYLMELSQAHSLSHKQLAEELGRSKSWISRRLSFVKILPKSVQSFVRAGKISSDGAMKYLVPMSRDNAADCIQLSTNISKDYLSSRQIGQIYKAWTQASGEQRKRIVQQPILYLKAEAVVDAIENSEDIIFRELESLCSKCFRVRKKFAEQNAALSHPLQNRLHDVWVETHASFSILSSLLEDKLNVGSKHSPSDPKTSQ